MGVDTATFSFLMFESQTNDQKYNDFKHVWKYVMFYFLLKHMRII